MVMVMTVLEAQVDQTNWPALEDAYKRETAQLDPGIVQTLLVQSKNDPHVWRIMTIWESQAALDDMRKSNDTPRGVLMFRQANAQPNLSIFDIISQAAVMRAP